MYDLLTDNCEHFSWLKFINNYKIIFYYKLIKSIDKGCVLLVKKYHFNQIMHIN